MIQKTEENQVDNIEPEGFNGNIKPKIIENKAKT